MSLLDCQPASRYRPVGRRWRRSEGIRLGPLPAPARRAGRWLRRALPALRAALGAHPEIRERYGDLAAHARCSRVELIAGTDLDLAEALARKAATPGAGLAGSSPTPRRACRPRGSSRAGSRSITPTRRWPGRGRPRSGSPTWP